MRCFLLLGFTAGLLPLVGCGSEPAHTLGKLTLDAPKSAVASLLPAKAALPTRPVTLHGTMVEKCPAAGCWLRLHDKSGTIKVDLRSSGVTATDIPNGTEMTVTGVATRVGDEPTVQASGLTY